MSQLLEVTLSKRVRLESHFAKDLPRFDGDATQVRQVVMNLITNASEAIGDEEGVVRLTTGTMMCDRACLDGPAVVRDCRHGAVLREGRYVYLEVSDTGCGMTSETIGRIFEPFFTTKFTGRGLGLSALLGIVHSHAGAIEIRSEPGMGTRVRVLFPANTAVDEPSIASLRSPSSDMANRGLILLVDDDETIRRAVRQMLEHIGFDVVVAGDGRDAIEVFREHQQQITAVVLDLTMPVMNGEQTFRALRAISPDVKVVLSSGYTDLEVSRRFASGGLAGFLKKPFDIEELQGVLARALDDRRPITVSPGQSRPES